MNEAVISRERRGRRLKRLTGEGLELNTGRTDLPVTQPRDVKQCERERPLAVGHSTRIYREPT